MNDQEQRAKGQFKLQLNGVMSPFTLYGLGVLIPQAKEEITTLALQLHERLNNKDVPIIINKIR